MRGFLRMLTSAVFVIPALLLLLLAAIVIFGLGLNGRMAQYIERMEHAQRTALDVALARAAEIEAQGLAQLIPQQGAATIGTPPPVTAKAEDGSDTPALRPRDIEDILSQETDMLAEELEREMAAAEEEQAAALAHEEAAAATAAGVGPQAALLELDKLIREGIAALIKGDMRRSILNFEQARTINPKHPALLYYYGMAYDKLLNPEKAREYYTELYQMRDAAGKYFERAAKRLTYGISTASAMRGKLAFGPKMERASVTDSGQSIEVVLPILLANNEDLLAEDIYIHIQFFDLKSGKNITLSETAPNLLWENEAPTWEDYEEKLIARYEVNAADATNTPTEYYGFTAKLYYKGEPMDCVSSPSVLILHEHNLNRSTNNYAPNDIIPSDGLDYTYEEALPYSDVY